MEALGPALLSGAESQLTQKWVTAEAEDGDLIIGTLPHFEQIMSVRT